MVLENESNQTTLSEKKYYDITIIHEGYDREIIDKAWTDFLDEGKLPESFVFCIWALEKHDLYLIPDLDSKN